MLCQREFLDAREGEGGLFAADGGCQLAGKKSDAINVRTRRCVPRIDDGGDDNEWMVVVSGQEAKLCSV